MRVLPVALVSALLATAACGASTTFAPTNPSPRQLYPRTTESVQIFSSQPPSRPYVEIGIIQGSQGSSFFAAGDQTPEIISQMRVEAAEIGCDGLIINGNANRRSNDLDGRVHTTQGFWGSCIVFQDGATPPSQVPPTLTPSEARAEALTEKAREWARNGRCDAVRRLDDDVAHADRAYHDRVFVHDPTIAPCLY